MSSYKTTANQIVEMYCQSYGVTLEDIAKTYARTGRAKVLNGVHLDRLRMALSYFLEMRTDLSLPVIASLCGYKCHSTICQNRDNITFYIEMADKEFYPYWLRVVEIGDKLLPNDVKRKIYKPKRKTLSPHVFKNTIYVSPW